MNFLEWIERRPARLIGHSAYLLEKMAKTAKRYGVPPDEWIAADDKQRRLYAYAIQNAQRRGKKYPLTFEEHRRGKRIKKKHPPRRLP